MKTSSMFVILIVVAASGSLPFEAFSGNTPVTSFSFGEDWNSEQQAPALKAFRDWTVKYSNIDRSTSRGSLMSEGIHLARSRRVVLENLIRSDPARAISLAIPASVRKTLPPQVVNELETLVSGIGNFSVLAYFPSRGAPALPPYQRIVRLNGAEYRTYVYGRRMGQTSKLGIPLHGIAINGELALHEDVLRRVEADEVAGSIIDLTSHVSAGSRREELLAQVGNIFYRLGSADHLQNIEESLEAAEAETGPEPRESAEEVMSKANLAELMIQPQVPSTLPWTTGTKQVLVIRVDFSDRPGPPGGMSAADIQSVMDTKTAPFFVRSSYGLTDLTTTVTEGVYRMPQTAAYYATNSANDQLHTDAENLARTNYPVDSYDRVIVLFSLNDPSTGWGIADVGGKRVWINNYFDLSFTAHELGHTYGNWHANLWQVSDSNPASPFGHHVEYGDPFDVMGGGGYLLLQTPDTIPDYNEFFKNRLGWIADSQVTNVTANGIYRIYRFDDISATGSLALKITGGARDYWVGARRAFPSNPSMQNGAYILWGYDDSRGSELLDMSTPGVDTSDAALPIGGIFADPSAGFTIKAVAEGGSPPHQFVDVQINFITIPPYDFDLDGKTDYVLYNASTLQTAIWYLNNNVYRSGAIGPTLPLGWSLVNTTDFNGDGKPDYVLFNMSTRQTAIWYLNGNVYVGGGYGPSVPIGWQLVSTGDFNSDGKPDYVLYAPGSRQTAIWYMNNRVYLSGGYGPTLPVGWQVVGVGDFDLDGHADYLLFNAVMRQSAIWYMSGRAFVRGVYGPTIASGYQLKGTADFNSDEHPDYALYNASTRQTAIWYMNNNAYVNGVFGPTLPVGWSLVLP